MRKKNLLNKSMALALSVVTVMGSVPTTAYASDTSTDQAVTYTVDEDGNLQAVASDESVITETETVTETEEVTETAESTEAPAEEATETAAEEDTESPAQETEEAQEQTETETGGEATEASAETEETEETETAGETVLSSVEGTVTVKVENADGSAFPAGAALDVMTLDETVAGESDPETEKGQYVEKLEGLLLPEYARKYLEANPDAEATQDEVAADMVQITR